MSYFVGLIHIMAVMAKSVLFELAVTYQSLKVNEPMMKFIMAGAKAFEYPRTNEAASFCRTNLRKQIEMRRVSLGGRTLIEQWSAQAFGPKNAEKNSRKQKYFKCFMIYLMPSGCNVQCM